MYMYVYMFVEHIIISFSRILT